MGLSTLMLVAMLLDEFGELDCIAVPMGLLCLFLMIGVALENSR